MTARSQFDVETAVVAAAPDRWDATLAAAWSIGANLNGGYALVPVLRALASLADQPDPLTVTTHFLRPVQGGPAIVEGGLVRRGRSLTVAAGTLIAAQTARLTVSAVFGDLAIAAGASPVVTLAPPDLPPPDECVDRADLDQGVELPLLGRVDVRLDRRSYSGRHNGAAGPPAVQGWVRFADGAAPDVLALTLFADAFPPALTAAVDDLGWVPSIELTVHVRRRPAPGWVMARFECDDLFDGRMIESGTLWDSTGAVVARCRQIGLVLNAPAGQAAGGADG